jgi:hypothetical protein
MRNAISEYMNQEMTSTCWMTNVMDVADSLKVTLKSKLMSGFVQRFQVAPDFCLTLHCDKQLEAIHRVPPNDRMVHFDASGGLCKITKAMCDYNQILNYVFILKDAKNMDNPSVVVNEVISSKHDSCRIGEMFHLLKHNYLKKFDTRLYFRYLVLDLSWASIHGALENLNLETVEEYAVRIYKYSKGLFVDESKSFLASCLSHTMHRFTRGLKKHVKFEDSENKTFAACCFSLLVNSIELEESKDLFKLICIVFKNPFLVDEVLLAIKALQSLIQVRPENSIEVKKMLKEIVPNLINDAKPEIIPNVDTKKSIDEIDDDWYESNFKTTIKAASPFTEIFLEIESASIVSTSSLNVNQLHNEDFINFLQSNFMPYIFIWAGFVFRDSKHNIKSITQGIIEKQFGTRKRIYPHPQVPARHIITSCQSVLSNCAISDSVQDDKEIENMDVDSSSKAIEKWKPNKHRRVSINRANQLLKKAKSSSKT